MNIRLLPINVAVLAALAACSTSAQVAPRADLLGTAVPPAAATQAVTITPETRWVNVTGGDTVRFLVGGSEFGWAFNVGPTVAMFDLNRVAPPGLLNRALPVYVDPDPFYSIGGNGREPARAH